jgi:glycosyltransferase involved in cell wall biosynthesis
MKKVSVLIAVYNKEKYIIDTLKSINAQVINGKFTLEVCIVDDCSTDNSLELMRNFIWKPEIEVKITQSPQNSGPSVCMNLALSNSTGDYIVPHDADDLVTRLGILKRFEALESNPDFDWVTGNELMMDVDGHVSAGREFVKTYTWNNNTELQELIMGKMLIPAQSIMIRRHAAEDVKWNNNLWASQDTWINYMLTLKGYQLMKIDDYVAIYRSPGSAGNTNSSYNSSVKSGRMYKDYLVIKEVIKEYLTPKQLSWFDGIIEGARPQ